MKESLAKNRNILQHAANYFGANMATQALGFISLPILTRLLSQEDFGTINLYSSLLSFSVVLFSLNLHAAIPRYYYDNNKGDIGKFISTSVISILIVYLLFISFSLFFQDSISYYLNVKKDVFYTILLVTPFLILQSIYDSYNKASNQSRAVMLNSMILSYGKFLLTLFFILLFFKSYQSKLLADLIVLALMSIVYVGFILKRLEKGFSMDHLKYILLYSLPLIPHSLSNILLHSFDKVMINKYCNEKDLALYSFAYTIGMLSFIVYQSIHTAAMPEFFKMMNEGRYNDVEKQSHYLSKMSLMFSCGIALFGADVGRFLGPEKYHSALSLIPVVVLGYVLMSFYQVYGRLVFYSKKTYLVAISTLGAGILNVLLNIFLIPEYGYEVAAYTTAFSFFYTLISSWFIVRFVVKSPAVSPIWSKLKLLLVFFTVFAFTYLAEEYFSSNKWLLFLVKLPLIFLLIRFFFFDVFNEFAGSILSRFKRRKV